MNNNRAISLSLFLIGLTLLMACVIIMDNVYGHGGYILSMICGVAGIVCLVFSALRVLIARA